MTGHPWVMGEEFNLVNRVDQNSRRVPISDDAPFVPDLNPSPGHDVRDLAAIECRIGFT